MSPPADSSAETLCKCLFLKSWRRYWATSAVLGSLLCSRHSRWCSGDRTQSLLPQPPTSRAGLTFLHQLRGFPLDSKLGVRRLLCSLPEPPQCFPWPQGSCSASGSVSMGPVSAPFLSPHSVVPGICVAQSNLFLPRGLPRHCCRSLEMPSHGSFISFRAWG